MDKQLSLAISSLALRSTVKQWKITWIRECDVTECEYHAMLLKEVFNYNISAVENQL